MFVGVGTLINVIAILIGTFLGRLFGDRIKLRTRELLTDVLGAVTLIGAASAVTSLFKDELLSAVPDGFPILIVLTSLILGGLIGSWLKIEDRLNTLGEKLKDRFAASETAASNEDFVVGFVTASLIFVIGPLAILGSISDGMSTGIDQLMLKSILDFFASIAFAASLGWGVAFSAIPVGIYQGLWTIVGLGLGNVLNDYQVQAMTATGGVLLLGIAFKLLRIKEIAIGDLLPALAFAPLFALLAARI
ncbi:MAG: DUF554 domain-containing protein [Candidatus Nanopelagicaceae bacterium]|nr:DUF554 domain-containing protein [Candidatus Nanopelagicaceae bacterium]